jgi:cold shock CspA family protein
LAEEVRGPSVEGFENDKWKDLRTTQVIVEETIVKGLRRRTAVAASVLVLGALGAGVAWAAPAQQQPLVGKVTRVSVSGGFFVVNGKVVYVRRTTVIRLARGGLRGLRAGRRVRVTVVERNGKLYAVDVRLARAAVRARFTG